MQPYFLRLHGQFFLDIKVMFMNDHSIDQVERSWDSETAGRFAALPIESNEKLFRCKRYSRPL
jgi:hypothetical protein